MCDHDRARLVHATKTVAPVNCARPSRASNSAGRRVGAGESATRDMRQDTAALPAADARLPSCRSATAWIPAGGPGTERGHGNGRPSHVIGSIGMKRRPGRRHGHARDPRAGAWAGVGNEPRRTLRARADHDRGTNAWAGVGNEPRRTTPSPGPQVPGPADPFDEARGRPHYPWDRAGPWGSFLSLPHRGRRRWRRGSRRPRGCGPCAWPGRTGGARGPAPVRSRGTSASTPRSIRRT